MKTYLCPRCRRELPRDAFGNHAGKVDDRDSYCRPCKIERQRADRSTDAGRARARDAQRRSRARRSGASRGSLPASPLAA